MDSLVVLGTTSAWLYGLCVLFIGYQLPTDYNLMNNRDQQNTLLGLVHEHAHNFEISSTLITVILFGKCLEAYSKKQTIDKLADLASLKPTRACLVREYCIGKLVSDYELSGRGREVDPELLLVGDIVRVGHGQTVPIDGTVLKGSGLVNESMLTGESRPIVKEVEANVFAGTLLTRGDILVRVDKKSNCAAINQIMRLVENA